MLEVKIKKMLFHYELNVDFHVSNEILVLFGPSGSGKTTILDSIAGLIQPDAGVIRMDERTFYGQDVKTIPTQARNMGYLFQDYALFPHMTVEKNIHYGVKKNVGKTDFVIGQLLDVLGIQHLLQKYPHQISGGEKQRVALARSLATEPSVLLLDEPLSALDKETRLECQSELLRLHALWQIPFIIVTHDFEEAERLGHRILFLESGEIVDCIGNMDNR